MTFKDEKGRTVMAAPERVLAAAWTDEADGIKTFKSERAILESLEPEVRAAVALQLNKQHKTTDKDNDNAYAYKK